MKDLFKVFAFIRRDFIVMKGYRFSLLLSLFSMLLGIATYFFLAKLFGDKGLEILNSYGGRYFPYVLIGIALSGFLMSALGTFKGSLMGERSMGTLEMIVSTPTKEYLIFLGISLWNFLFSSLSVGVYILIGVFVFDFDLSKADPFAFTVILFISTLVFSCLGVLSAGFILIFKRGNPITWLFSSVSILVGGVYFPVEILPSYLRTLSKFVPLTYSLSALRKAIINGENLLNLKEEIVFLSIFALILLPLSIFFFRFALSWVKKNGALIHY